MKNSKKNLKYLLSSTFCSLAIFSSFSLIVMNGKNANKIEQLRKLSANENELLNKELSSLSSRIDQVDNSNHIYNDESKQDAGEMSMGSHYSFLNNFQSPINLRTEYIKWVWAFPKYRNAINLDENLGIIKINDFAFCDEVLPNNFYLPLGTATIGTSAFAAAKLPNNFTLPNTVSYLGWNAFGNAQLPNNFQINNPMQWFDSRVFWGSNVHDKMIAPAGTPGADLMSMQDLDSNYFYNNVSRAIAEGIVFAGPDGKGKWYANNKIINSRHLKIKITTPNVESENIAIAPNKWGTLKNNQLFNFTYELDPNYPFSPSEKQTIANHLSHFNLRWAVSNLIKSEKEISKSEYDEGMDKLKRVHFFDNGKSIDWNIEEDYLDEKDKIDFINDLKNEKRGEDSFLLPALMANLLPNEGAKDNEKFYSEVSWAFPLESYHGGGNKKVTDNLEIKTFDANGNLDYDFSPGEKQKFRLVPKQGFSLPRSNDPEKFDWKANKFLPTSNETEEKIINVDGAIKSSTSHSIINTSDILNDVVSDNLKCDSNWDVEVGKRINNDSPYYEIPEIDGLKLAKVRDLGWKDLFPLIPLFGSFLNLNLPSEVGEYFKKNDLSAEANISIFRFDPKDGNWVDQRNYKYFALVSLRATDLSHGSDGAKNFFEALKKFFNDMLNSPFALGLFYDLEHNIGHILDYFNHHHLPWSPSFFPKNMSGQARAMLDSVYSKAGEARRKIEQEEEEARRKVQEVINKAKEIVNAAVQKVREVETWIKNSFGNVVDKIFGGARTLSMPNIGALIAKERLRRANEELEKSYDEAQKILDANNIKQDIRWLITNSEQRMCHLPRMGMQF